MTPINHSALLLSVTPISGNVVRKHYKRLHASRHFQIQGYAVIHASGVFVPATSRWLPPVCLDDGHCLRRFARIEIFYHGHRYTYAIPADLVDKHPGFPALPFSTGEISLLYLIAEELRSAKSFEEIYRNVPRRERIDVKISRDLAMTLPSDDKRVAALIEQSPWVLEVMEVALLATLRAWMPANCRPNHLTAFIAPKGSGLDTHTALVQLLAACNLAVPATAPQLPQITTTSVGDLDRWSELGSRMILLTVRDDARKKLVKRAESLALSRITGLIEPSFEAMPLIGARDSYPSSLALNINLPEDPPPWKLEDLDALRAVMAKLIAHPKRQAKRATALYRRQVEGTTGYRITSAAAWCNAASVIIQDGLSAQCQAVATAREALRQQAELKEVQLTTAVDYLLNPANYADRICTEWPPDKHAVNTLLNGSDGAVALWKESDKANFLAFTEASLRCLVSKAGLPNANFNLLVERLKTLGILSSRTTPVKLTNGKTMRLIRIDSDNLPGFVVSMVSTAEEVIQDG